MARHKKKKDILSKDVLSSGEKLEDFTIANSAVWYEANPDKSKKYGKKEFKKKEFLTPKEALIFLGVTEVWLRYFVQGEKGFPKLPYTWEDNNKATARFARKDLVEYRAKVRPRMLSIKAKQISKCHEHERDQ